MQRQIHLLSGTGVFSCSDWHAQTSLAAKPASPPLQRKGESCQPFIHLFPLSTFHLVQHLGSICKGVHSPCRRDGLTQPYLYFILSLPRLCHTRSEATSCKQQEQENKISVGLCPDQQPRRVGWQPAKEMLRWCSVCSMKYGIRGTILGWLCLLVVSVVTMIPSWPEDDVRTPVFG